MAQATVTDTRSSKPKRSFMDTLLDGVELLGNKVPHPVLMFVYLIVFVIVVSSILALLGVSVTEEVGEPVPYEVSRDFYADTTEVQTIAPAEGLEWSDVTFQAQHQTIPVKGLLTIEGIRFLFTSFVTNFQNFGVIAVTFIAMMGAGLAEGVGMMGALIRKLVAVAPARLIAFLIILVGGLSSVASDAGYLILIPLAAAAFASLKRNPIAGLAAGFAGVAATFAVNIIIQPIDAMLGEMTNEAIALTGGAPQTIVNNFFFSAVSLIFLCVVATIITERLIEPRLNAADAAAGIVPTADGASTTADEELDDAAKAAEARGLRFALYGFLAVLVVVLLATLPPGAPLRDPSTGNIVGNTPFMDSLLFIIAAFFLVSGICYGAGAGTISGSNDVIAAITKTFSSLGGLILMFLLIAQFLAYFNYTNLPRVIAVALADLLERAAIPALPLLILFILVIVLLDFILPGVIPKWAIFAPIFVPIFIRLDVGPQTLLAAYRIGDSPVNTLTPLMVYFPFIVTVAQRYRKDAGLGTIVSLMLPYAVIMLAAWVVLFVVWYALNIPLGPGYLPRG
ncbi:MAG: AbgT family transporter [Chloroflexi bacterium]|nr:AbgT family transporter [Chloroflexota bacterium]